jgi:hypothetical protein
MPVAARSTRQAHLRPLAFHHREMLAARFLVNERF